MKALKPKPSSQFGKKLESVVKGIDQSLLWLESARKSAPRLEMEADRLSVRLQSQHNKATRLIEASGQECAIGFFGLAQAGKAWLIAALAASEKGRMELALGSANFDYARLNPQQQSATMVMRFSGRQVSTDHEWPVQLSLMSEEEIVGVLADLQAKRSGQPTLDEQQIAERMKSVAVFRQPQPVEGMSSTNVVALWQRLNSAQLCRSKALESHFWPQAVELAPFLGVDDRARLFSLLWNEDRELSALYRQLAHVLHHLSNTRRVLAPIGTVDDPGLSVLNSSGLRYFNASADRVIQVVPQHNGRSLKPVTLALGELNLLSREVLLPLFSAPRESLFEQVDLLDYPGFEAPSVLPDDAAHELALAFTAAKRPFLLTRAAERQDVDLLMVCNAAGQRADARVVGRALDNWVKQTQSQARNGRKPGLIWALTPFDQRVTQGQNHDAAVQRFVGNPGDSWGTMLAMDDKGVKRMAGWLTSEIKRESKMARLQEQLNEIRRELSDNLLGRWYLAAEKEEPQARLRVAESLLKALQARTGVHGELLERLLPTRETLRHLFMQQQHPAERRSHDEYALTEEDPFGIGISIDLLSDEPLPVLSTNHDAMPEEEAETGFAQQVYRYWINLLAQLPEEAALLELLGIAKPTLEMLTEELTTASIRLNIEEALVKILADQDAANTPAELLADRQVSRALSVLGDFVAWLGFQHLPEAERPESKINRGQKIFARPESQAASLGPTQRLTRLSLKPNNYAAWYIYDWLVALNETILLNAGYSAAREIDDEHRQQLAAILKQLAN